MWLFSIYGYSFVNFIIATALTIIPVNWMKWAVLCYAGLMSMIYIFKEMYHLIKSVLNESIAKFFILALWLVVTHGVFITSLR